MIEECFTLERTIAPFRQAGTRKGYCVCCHSPIVIEDGAKPICHRNACFVEYVRADRTKSLPVVASYVTGKN